MFFHSIIGPVSGYPIWNGMHVMPATHSGGGKSVEQIGARGQNRPSHASRQTEPLDAHPGEQAKEQRKLQAEDDCVVLLCRD